MKPYHFLLEILRKVYMKFGGKPIISADGQFRENIIFETNIKSDYEDIIQNLLSGKTPIMIARFGSIELDCFNNWRLICYPELFNHNEHFSWINYIMDRVYPSWIGLRSINGMANNAGFFPSNEKNILQWGYVYNDAYCNLDVLLSWQNNEKYLGWEGAKIPMHYVTYPFLYENPWTTVLKDKRVLVISPFSKSIEHQYKKRKMLFENSNILPDFKLITMQSYNVLRGKNHSDCNSWFEALDRMCKQMNEIEFDIALIGCGAYAFPLASYAKTIGKKAITLCGGIQLLFGIYGNRWERFLIEKRILNKYWIRPIDEKPEGFEKVENSAYW